MKPIEAAHGIFAQLVAWRRDFHMHPEIGLETVRTAGIVADELRQMGYTVQTGIAENGVVGLLENGDGAVVMNRVDMDALPVHELSDEPYASQIPGAMHACGHDAHTAMGLGIAKLMAENQDVWRGTLKLVFQPGEEGQHGAEIMVKEGVLENPRPQVALALHVWNQRPYGSILASTGPVMAAAEEFEVVITGKGGHGALPHRTVDPVAIAALMITNLQTIVSRNVGALEAAVLTVGSVHSGDAFNVIPATAVIGGTIRTYEPEVRQRVLNRLEAIVQGTAKMMGATAELTFTPHTPALVNDASVTALVREVVTEMFGKEKLGEMRTMGSEDASFFQREIPGCYIFVASGPEDYLDRPQHNARFDIDERAMINGVAVIVESLLRLMPVNGD